MKKHRWRKVPKRLITAWMCEDCSAYISSIEMPSEKGMFVSVTRGIGGKDKDIRLYDVVHQLPANCDDALVLGIHEDWPTEPLWEHMYDWLDEKE